MAVLQCRAPFSAVFCIACELGASLTYSLIINPRISRRVTCSFKRSSNSSTNGFNHSSRTHCLTKNLTFNSCCLIRNLTGHRIGDGGGHSQ